MDSLQHTCSQIHEIGSYVSVASEQLSQRGELIYGLADSIMPGGKAEANRQAVDEGPSVCHSRKRIRSVHVLQPGIIHILREHNSITERALELNKRIIRDQALIIVSASSSASPPF